MTLQNHEGLDECLMAFGEWAKEKGVDTYPLGGQVCYDAFRSAWHRKREAAPLHDCKKAFEEWCESNLAPSEWDVEEYCWKAWQAVWVRAASSPPVEADCRAAFDRWNNTSDSHLAHNRWIAWQACWSLKAVAKALGEEVNERTVEQAWCDDGWLTQIESASKRDDWHLEIVASDVRQLCRIASQYQILMKQRAEVPLATPQPLRPHEDEVFEERLK